MTSLPSIRVLFFILAAAFLGLPSHLFAGGICSDAGKIRDAFLNRLSSIPAEKASVRGRAETALTKFEFGEGFGQISEELIVKINDLVQKYGKVVGGLRNNEQKEISSQLDELLAGSKEFRNLSDAERRFVAIELGSLSQDNEYFFDFRHLLYYVLSQETGNSSRKTDVLLKQLHDLGVQLKALQIEEAQILRTD